MTAGKKRTTVTMADVAAAAGVDKSSVSLALRGSPRVSAEKRRKIVEIAHRLGYRLNLAARQLTRTGKTSAVALVLPAAFGTLSRPVAAATIQTIAARTAADNVLFFVMPTGDLARLTEFVADGFFVWGDVAAEELKPLVQQRRPIVVLDPNHRSFENWPGHCVRVDNAGGAAALTRHLVEGGARRLLFVLEDDAHGGQYCRWESARRTWLENRPLESLSFCRLQELADEHLLNFANRPDGALFCSNDLCALQVWHRLQKLGRAVPGDVRLVGFDGEPSGDLIQLTTAVFDGAKLAEAGFKVLNRLIDGQQAPRETCIDVTLRLGATSGER